MMHGSAQSFSQTPTNASVDQYIASPLEGEYRLDTQRLAHCEEPIQLIGNTALVFLTLGLLMIFLPVDPRILISLTSAVFTLGVFYMLGQGMLYRYVAQAKQQWIDLDSETGLIHYRDADEELLFERQQVILCEWRRSLLFPYRVDEVRLYLEGGKEIRCSNLVLESPDLILWLQAPLLERFCWFL
ncbi:MAG: hypothetical protein AAFQ68_13625 [Bacteroidota bacterium]